MSSGRLRQLCGPKQHLMNNMLYRHKLYLTYSINCAVDFLIGGSRPDGEAHCAFGECPQGLVRGGSAVQPHAAENAEPFVQPQADLRRAASLERERHQRRPRRRRHGHRHWRHRHVHVYPRPVIYSAAPAVYAAKPAVNPCTCLTKEYTPEGAVLFKDICTNEAAINPPPAAAPQQTGMYQPDPSVAPTPAPQR